jgi:hypothetical protein
MLGIIYSFTHYLEYFRSENCRQVSSAPCDNCFGAEGMLETAYMNSWACKRVDYTKNKS